MPPVRGGTLSLPGAALLQLDGAGPRSFIDGVLWPEFLEIKQVLDEYLNQATERIIREEVFQNAREPQERTG